jgi:hypothetical protein
VRQRDLRHRETYRFDAFQPEKAIIAVRAYAFVLPAESSAGVVLGTQAHHCAGADPSGRIPCHWTHLHFGREKLTVIQAENSKAQEVRSSTISLTIASFKHSIENVVGKLRAASMKLEMSSVDLNKAADTMSPEADIAKQRVGAVSDNVTAVASSIEELAASIGEIASQAANRPTLRAARYRKPSAPSPPCPTSPPPRLHRRGSWTNPGDRGADQSAGAQRHHRGRARR